MIALKNTDRTLLIDANIYPGSSGSPVFYRPILVEQEYRELSMVGLVSNHVLYHENAFSETTRQLRAVFAENSGLGIVQSSSLLLDIFSYLKPEPPA